MNHEPQRNRKYNEKYFGEIEREKERQIKEPGPLS